MRPTGSSRQDDRFGPPAEKQCQDDPIDSNIHATAEEFGQFCYNFSTIISNIYRQPNSVGMPYCDTAPKNSELLGYFQCQFQGSNLSTFSNGEKAGGANTLPFQHTALNPPGSCPANPQGPIADGQQLVDITQNPGPPSTGKTTPGSLIVTSPSPVRFDASSDTSDTPDASSTGDFHLQNGQDAQKLNAKFAGLTPASTCTAGEDACIGGQFAQCVGTSFVSTPCGAGTECFALPLVNKPGTSVTCTTQSDAVTRIAATGATGGLTGSG
jgi:hypothetical protein